MLGLLSPPTCALVWFRLPASQKATCVDILVNAVSISGKISALWVLDFRLLFVMAQVGGNHRRAREIQEPEKNLFNYVPKSI